MLDGFKLLVPCYVFFLVKKQKTRKKKRKEVEEGSWSTLEEGIRTIEETEGEKRATLPTKTG